MSGFFNPQGFLTAMKQEVARAHQGWALDQVSMTNEVLKIGTDECKKPPKEGVYVHGLYLDGAGWDRKTSRLVESTNKVLYVLMPVVHISAINSTAPKSSKLYTVSCVVRNELPKCYYFIEFHFKLVSGL